MIEQVLTMKRTAALCLVGAFCSLNAQAQKIQVKGNLVDGTGEPLIGATVKVKGNGTITYDIAQMALKALNIDQYGLDEIDNKILTTIIDKFRGGPVGVSTIATAIGEDGGTVEEVYEPFLIMEGFIKRTPRGRMATPLAYEHLGRNPYTSNIMQGDLFE